MKAFVIAGKHDTYFVDKPIPKIENEYSVKVKVKSVGICGTDIHIYEGEHGMSIGHKRIPGHEFAGVVCEVGSQVTNLKIGDRVVHEPINFCGKCYACRHGQGNVCADIQVTGCNMDGGLQEYYVADEKQWHIIPDWVTWEQAALIEPYTIAAQTCSQAELEAGDVVLIHGGGPIGLMCMDTAKKLGATVIISEIAEGRIKLAQEMGADYVFNPKEVNIKEELLKITGNEGPNIVIDCAGIPQVVCDAMELLSPAGRFVQVAPCPINLDKTAIWIMVKQLKIIGSRLQMNQFKPVIARYALYKDNIEKMITDVFDFEKAKEAFEYNAARHPETGKVVIIFKD